MPNVKGFLYRYTGSPLVGNKMTSIINFPTIDSNVSSNLYPIKRGAGTAYSYVVALAYCFDVDPGYVAEMNLWPALVGGSLDAGVSIKIATTLPATYIPATGRIGNTGLSIATLYSGVTTEDFMVYTANDPWRIDAADLIKTSGTGRFSNFILLQAEVSPAAALAAFPVPPIQLKIGHSASEST